ncbi:metal-dependent hydrolase [Scytonema sp. NUACC21]
MDYSNIFIKQLKLRWESLLQQFDASNQIGDDIFIGIVQAYSNPNRYYHNLNHIEQVLDKITECSYIDCDLSTVKLAAWFHDVIYDTKSRNNEENSAEYAVLALSKLKIAIASITKVKSLILKTKTHQPFLDDIESQILIDADLSILGASEFKYMSYAQSIRREYSWVPDREYRQERKKVLQSFLQKEKIYSTEHMFLTLEEAARKNIKAEILALS